MVTDKRCAVPPPEYGTRKWDALVTPMLPVGEKRKAEGQTAREWAEEHAWRDLDAMDLRALGYCYHCGRPGVLRKIGQCVYFCFCGGFRAYGDVKRMRAFLERRVKAMTPERRAALLALVTTS